jgi:hypothetical protein
MDQDERIKTHLARKEKIYGTINQSKYQLEKSLGNLDDYLNKSSRGFSPRHSPRHSPRRLSPLKK